MTGTESSVTDLGPHLNVGKILGRLFLAHHSKPFSWGENDCVTWAGDCAHALTGQDPIADLRGTYASEIAARRILVARGWRTVAGLAAARYAEIPVAQARAGDWLVIEGADGDMVLCVSFGERIATRGLDGLGWLPLTMAARAFRVQAS